jgi:uncharacterized membrane protein YidH (DUF202 family)
VSSRASIAAVVAVAGALVAAGSLLDWSGVAYSSHLDRGLALAAGLLMVLTSGLAVSASGRFLALAIPLGALALNMGFVNYDDVANNLHEYRAYPQAAVGVGLYLVIVGACLGIAAGVGTLVPRRWLSSMRRGIA